MHFKTQRLMDVLEKMSSDQETPGLGLGDKRNDDKETVRKYYSKHLQKINDISLNQDNKVLLNST